MEDKNTNRKMKFYLSSYKIGNKGNKLKEMIPNKRIGIIANALDNVPDVKKKFTEESFNELRQLDLEPEVLDLKNYFGKLNELFEKLDELKAVFITGGNTFVLVQAMKLSGFDRYVQTHLDDDFIYSGFSAANCILYKSLKPFQIVDKSDSFPYKEIKETIKEGLGILDYVILPHFDSRPP